MSSDPSTSGTPGRTLFLDRLRVTLTLLVIIHHAAITYGASGSWFYREVTDGGRPTSILLSVLAALNQSFFMGLFFLLAGYFTPASWRRRGTAGFLAERGLRLGLPLMVFGLVLGPLTVALSGWPQGRPVLSRWLDLMQSGTFVIGPLWFALALLLFAGAWVTWIVWRGDRPARAGAALPGWRAWLAAALGVGAAALLLRQWMPVGQSLWGLQWGYFASYVFLFALGCHAAAGRWLEQVSSSQARGWALVSALVAPTLFVVVALAGGLAGKPVNVNTGFGLPAVVYAFWEPLVAWGIIAALLRVFRQRMNEPSRLWELAAANAYGAFVLHAPVLVGLSVLLAPAALPAALKFVLVSTAAAAASFALAAGLRRLPGVRRVL